MIALFTILYVFCIWLFYVKMKIKPNPINVASAIVVGVVAVGSIVILWKFSSPTSGNIVVSRYSIPIVPQVKGPITKLNALPNTPLRKGQDVLFEVQKDPYEFAVRQLEGTLAAATQNVNQSQAAIEVADAAILEAKANRDSAKAEFDSAEESEAKLAGTIGEVRLKQLEQKLAASEATITKTEASQRQAVAALAVAESTVESTQASLEKAQFDLEQCVVYAPADGFVTNWQVREGTMAVPLPLAPMGTFIDTSDVALVATFGQNILKNVKPGDKAEFALKSRPGEVLIGEVEAIIQASGEGQFATSGQLNSVTSIGSGGQFAVKFKLDNQETAQTVALGTAGMVAIYTDVGSPFHVISKVSVRIKAWMYYLIPM
ncbi:HlyD family secretion protein [Novipirellula artificiosorum]|uniref:Inner membrane protein YiaV n=1 Tax=Novipirellula artificiosorum TaxID=2528016 RepID=A0A5C6D1P1_9BACT|nr:efflux RND transporter periplasmic adaptor subunit [Novipirellula artificiosorum]TWU30842.1 Inner membrane protein YiaV precursor [Novipirellula artificiosorum]